MTDEEVEKFMKVRPMNYKSSKLPSPPQKGTVPKEEAKVAKTAPVKKVVAEESKSPPLFTLYEQDGVIPQEGIEWLCHDLSLSMESLEVLGLMYVCKCSQYGQILQDEFTNGMKTLGITTKANLETVGAEILAEIVKESSKDLWAFYQFAYKFYSEGKKFI